MSEAALRYFLNRLINLSNMSYWKYASKWCESKCTQFKFTAAKSAVFLR